MPILGRTRSGQMLFTQPQLREDARFTQSGYLNLLSSQRRPRLNNYEDVKPKDFDASQGHKSDYATEFNRIANEADITASKMENLVLEAGTPDQLSGEALKEFNYNAQKLGYLKYQRDQLDSTIPELEQEYALKGKELEDARVVGDDLSVSTVGQFEYFIPDTKINEQGIVEPKKVMEAVQDKDDVGMTWNSTTHKYDIKRHNPSGDYKYTGKFSKELTDIFGMADDQYKQGTVTKSTEIYTQDANGNLSMSKDLPLLAAYIRDSTSETDTESLQAAMNALWQHVKKNNSIMKDIGVQFGKVLFSQDMPQLFTGTREATAEDANNPFLMTEVKRDNNGKIIYGADGKPETISVVPSNDNETKAIQKLLTSGSSSLNSVDAAAIGKMQEQFAYVYSSELAPIFSSIKENVSYRKMVDTQKVDDGKIDPNSEKSNIWMNYDDPSFWKPIAKAEGTDDIPFMIVDMKNGVYSPTPSKRAEVPLSDNASVIYEQDKKDAIGEQITKLPGFEQNSTWIGGIQPEDWQAVTTSAIPADEAIGKTVLLKNGIIMNIKGLKTYYFSRDKKDVYIPGYKKSQGEIKYSSEAAGDEAIMHMKSGKIVFEDSVMQNKIIGYEPVPKIKEDQSFDFKASEWELMDQDGKVVASNFTNYVNNPSKYKLSSDKHYAVRNKKDNTEISIEDAFDANRSGKYEGDVKYYVNEPVKFDYGDEEKMAKFGFKKIAEIDYTGYNGELWTADVYHTTSAAGTGSGTDAGNTFSEDIRKGATASQQAVEASKAKQAENKKKLTQYPINK